MPNSRSTREKVRALWSELLLIDVIDADATFITLGGDSVAATQFVQKVREIWKVEVGLQLVLSDKTLSDVANEIESRWQIDVNRTDCDNAVGGTR